MKKIVTLLLAVCLLASALAGCASSAKTENKTIVVGASSTPHAEILEQVKDTLAKDGWTLEIPTRRWPTASWMRTTSSTRPISRASTPPTAPTLSPPRRSTMSRSASTATA